MAQFLSPKKRIFSSQSLLHPVLKWLSEIEYVFIYENNTYFYIMDSKLTLKLNKEVVDKAKAYASSRKKSLSRMIESYLKSVIDTAPSEREEKDIEITSYVKSIKTGVSVPEDLNYKEEYANNLLRKHQ